jgi:hypothetical protein
MRKLYATFILGKKCSKVYVHSYTILFLNYYFTFRMVFRKYN